MNDWGLGLLLGELRLVDLPCKKVLTIHNNSYQGNMWIPAIRNWSAMEFCFNKDSRKRFIDPRKIRKVREVSKKKSGTGHLTLSAHID